MVGQACPQIVRLAILDVDVPVPNVLARHGRYSDIFRNLLQAAAERINKTGVLSRQVKFQTTSYNCVDGEYPPDPALIDAILITGSRASAYDDEPWIHALDRYVLDIYRNYPHIRIFGSCFGHQLLCQALLRHHGVTVQRDPAGWELGVHEVQVASDFLAALPLSLTALPSYDGSRHQAPGSSGDRDVRFKVQFVHADRVVLPESPVPLPGPWVALGSSRHCSVQGVMHPGRVLTLQGHFEFDRFVNAETIKAFGQSWDQESRQAALKNVDQDDDADLLAELVTVFLAHGSCLTRNQ
ncbi:hypothetical protein VTO42DRAFT_3804 [Malbranchea cinnamomea]